MDEVGEKGRRYFDGETGIKKEKGRVGLSQINKTESEGVFWVVEESDGLVEVVKGQTNA